MKKNFRQIFLLAAFLALLDQISKWLVVNYFKLDYTKNTGIAFGIPIPYYILIVLTILLIGFIIYFARKELNLNAVISRIGTAFIIGGALGNLIDRLTNGYVIDFISIWKWPNFNLADSLITTGILLLIVFYGKIKKVNNSP